MGVILVRDQEKLYLRRVANLRYTKFLYFMKKTMTQSIKLAIGLFAVLVLWMLSGYLLKSPVTNSASQQTVTKVPDKMRVMVSTSKAKWVEPVIVANGQTAPNKESMLKAEIVGVVDKLLKKEGDQVKQGDIIIKLKLSDKLARLAQAKAKVFDEETTLRAIEHLHPQGYSAETKYNDTKTALASAKAQLLAMKIELSKTEIVAPFDGILNALNVEENDYLKAGNVAGSIVNNTPLIVEVGIAQTNINDIKVGSKAIVRLATGENLEGHVRFIAPKANMATRMFKVEIALPNPNHLRAGISSEATIFAPKVLTHFVSPALLSMNEQGTIGIKTVDGTKTVRFKPVKIIRANNQGLWLTGLNETVTLISTGQGFVADGENIIAIEDSSAKGGL